VVDEHGEIRGLGQVPLPQHFPRPGLVEHDPDEIWTTTLGAIRGALADAGVETRELAGIGITNQRETVVAWDRGTGKPVHHAIVWQDRRTAAICEELRAAGHETLIQERTGLTIDPYFSGTKLTWLFREYPAIRRRAEAGEVAVGTVDSWLAWRLTGGRRHVTDYSNASRTMLFNIRAARWDDELCELMGVPPVALPAVEPSRTAFGTTDEGVFGAGVPIFAIAGDQQSALYGQACTATGLAKNTYGTGCFLLVNRGADCSPSQHRLLTSLTCGAREDDLEFALEGSVFSGGSIVQWLRDGLGIIERAEDVEPLAASVEDAAGVSIVPAFTGLGAPYWDAAARGAILGLTRGVTRAHIARAALEAIAFSSTELLEAMERDSHRPIRELRVDGGASRNNLLMQLQADLAGVRVVRPRESETTALGAAYLAGIGAGVWAGDDEVATLWKVEHTFEPRLNSADRHARTADWKRAVARVLAGSR
jgi:glycerol kinase